MQVLSAVTGWKLSLVKQERQLVAAGPEQVWHEMSQGGHIASTPFS